MFSSNVNQDYDNDPNVYDPSARQSSDIDDDYGAGLTGFIETSDLRSQITKPPATRYDDIGKNSYGNTNGIYGSERLRGNPPNNFEDNGQSLAGDLDSIYQISSRNRNANRNQFEQPNSWSLNQYTNRNDRVTTTRRPFKSSNYATPKFGTFNAPSPASYDNNEMYGVKSMDDENAEMSTVKTFCLTKPVASTEPCRAARVFLRNYWFYDASDMECKIFTSDNCDPNRNKFLKMEECERECGGVGFENEAVFSNGGFGRGFKNAGGTGFGNMASYNNRGGWN